MPFVFTDIMGLESDDGIQKQDIAAAVEGSIEEGYKVRMTLYDMIIQ